MYSILSSVKLLCYAAILSVPLIIGGCGDRVAHAGDCFNGDTIALQYSRLLQIVECDSFTIADIKNPWGSGLLHRYVLVPRNSPLPCKMPGGTVLRTPLENMLLFSTVHTHLMGTLGVPSSIGGVCDSRYMLSSFIHERIADGAVKECGSSLNVDVERVVQLAPSAILVLPFENGGYGKIENLPYPIVECAEYMENSPLAAAEWVRFYGRLVGRSAVADSLFSVVCKNVEELRSLVVTVEERPSLMCELKSSSAWYVPAGESTMGQMYKMAGVDYLFAHCAGSGSVPLSFETVLSRAANADVWLMKYNSVTEKSYSSLLADFAGYAHFKPFKERKIYTCNTGRKPFFEETPFRPDILLRELIAIFYPQLLPSYELRYYEKMQE